MRTHVYTSSPFTVTWPHRTLTLLCSCSNQERSDTLFACHNVTRQWLKLKSHYDLEAMRINQHHRCAVKATMDTAMHGYLDNSLPVAPLQVSVSVRRAPPALRPALTQAPHLSARYRQGVERGR